MRQGGSVPAIFRSKA